MQGYLVLDFSIHDLDAFMAYVRGVPAFIDKHGGRYLVQGPKPEVMEGDWAPEGLVILEFPSTDHAKAFLNDPEFQELKKVRTATTTSKLVLAEGCT